MLKVKNGAVIAFDVDDTLVMWKIPKEYRGKTVEIKLNPNIPEVAAINEHMVDHLKRMHRRGHAVVVWSAAGSDWAEAVVKALKLQEYVDVVMPKLAYHMDDCKDHKDKLGRWGYIGIDGEYQLEGRDGVVKQWNVNEIQNGDRK